MRMVWCVLTCMRPLVYFQVLGAREHFTASWERTRKRFLPGVHANVVHQFVFGLEGLSLSRTFFPKAHVVALLRAADVLCGNVRHQLVHGAKGSAAAALLAIRFEPLAHELLFDALLPHVAEESCRVMVVMRGCCDGIQAVRVRTRVGGHLVMVVMMVVLVWPCKQRVVGGVVLLVEPRDEQMTLRVRMGWMKRPGRRAEEAAFWICKASTA